MTAWPWRTSQSVSWASKSRALKVKWRGALTSQSCPKTSEKSARSPISEVGARRSRQQHVAPSHFQSPMPTYRCPRRSHPSSHSLVPYTFIESKVGKSIVASHARCSMAQHRMGTDADLRSSGASPCMRRVTSTRMPAESASLSTRPPPCLRSLIGFHDTVDDELARPRRAADAAAQLERACRCSRRSRAFTLDEGGEQGVVCSCVVAVDVVRQLSMAMPQAGLVATTAWWCGQARAVRA